MKCTKARKYLAIDIGASSGRGIIGEFDGKKLTLRENHRFINSPVMIHEKLYWNIFGLYSSIIEAVRKSVACDDEIAGIGIDTWGVDYGIIDKYGTLCGNPRHYRDGRTADIAAEIGKKFDLDKIYNITGIQSMNFNTIYQLYAEMRDKPHVFDNGEKILFIPDLLNYFLTGTATTEYTIASTGAVLDAKSKKYAFNLLNELGIPHNIFCGGDQPIQPGAILGKLTPSILSDLGNCSANVFAVASHDTASAVLSVPAANKDFVYISSGTWSLLGAEIENPLINEKTRYYNYTNEGGVFGTIRFLKNIMGLWIVQECRRKWNNCGKNYSFAELSAMAEAEQPFKHLINPDEQIFAPPGDMPLRIMDYCRQTGQSVPESDGAVIRCVLDSLALCYKKAIDNLIMLTGIRPTAVNIVGGGTQNTLLCQLTADVTGLTVIAGPTEATATGNIASQLIASREASGLYEVRQIISDSFETVRYEPHISTQCDFAYERFLKLFD